MPSGASWSCLLGTSLDSSCFSPRVGGLDQETAWFPSCYHKIHHLLSVPLSYHRGDSGGFRVGGRRKGTWGFLRLSVSHGKVYELWLQSPQSECSSAHQIFAVSKRSAGVRCAQLCRDTRLMHRTEGGATLLEGL